MADRDRRRLAAADTRLRRAGLRGHVYITHRHVVWFATRPPASRTGIRANVGAAPLVEAFRGRIGSRDAAEAWLRSLGAGARTRPDIPAATVWNTPALVITGTPPAVALAGALQRPERIAGTALRSLLQETGVTTVDAADRTCRETTGLPLAANARSTVADALGTTIRKGDPRWLERWMTTAERLRAATAGTGREAEIAVALLVLPDPKTREWNRIGGCTCGAFEARTEAAGAGDIERGRLWIRDRPPPIGDDGPGATTLVLLDRDDTTRATSITGSEPLARWLHEIGLDALSEEKGA